MRLIQIPEFSTQHSIHRIRRTSTYIMAEKTQVPAPSAFSPYLETVASLFHPVAGPVYNSSARFHGWKESLGLVQPGTVENLTREVSRTWSSRVRKG